MHFCAFGHNITRICPGKELADSSLFLLIAMSLAVFNFEKAQDATGAVIEPRVEYTVGVVWCVMWLFTNLSMAGIDCR